jgi:hypothetical protein
VPAKRFVANTDVNELTTHRAALAMFFCQYNYCRKDRTLKGHTLAMAHGLTTEVWPVHKMLEAVLAA